MPKWFLAYDAQIVSFCEISTSISPLWGEVDPRFKNYFGDLPGARLPGAKTGREVGQVWENGHQSFQKSLVVRNVVRCHRQAYKCRRWRSIVERRWRWSERACRGLCQPANSSVGPTNVQTSMVAAILSKTCGRHNPWMLHVASVEFFS